MWRDIYKQNFLVYLKQNLKFDPYCFLKAGVITVVWSRTKSALILELSLLVEFFLPQLQLHNFTPCQSELFIIMTWSRMSWTTPIQPSSADTDWSRLIIQTNWPVNFMFLVIAPSNCTFLLIWPVQLVILQTAQMVWARSLIGKWIWIWIQGNVAPITF